MSGLPILPGVSPKDLLLISVLVLVGGVIVLNPIAGLFFLVLGGILTSVAAFFSSEGTRVLAFLLLAVAIFFSVMRFPEARRHFESVRERARKQSTNVPEIAGVRLAICYLRSTHRILKVPDTFGEVTG